MNVVDRAVFFGVVVGAILSGPLWIWLCWLAKWYEQKSTHDGFGR